MTSPPTTESKEVAVIEASSLITSVSGRDDVERFEMTVTLPASFQYVIPGSKMVPDPQDPTGQRKLKVPDNKVGITSDGYDYLNRVLGVSFWTPPTVPNSQGVMVPNPILLPDYIRWRMGGFWYNELGQLVSMTEDLEIDYKLVYQAARLETFGSVIVLDDNGQPMWDADGNPIIKLKDMDSEKKAMKALHQLRTMGPRYAQTVLRTRILKVAVGIKSLPGQEPVTRPVRVVGYRDRLDPMQRLEKAQEASTRIFGTTPVEADETNTVPAEVIAEIEGGAGEDRALTDVTDTLAAVMDDDGQGEFDLPDEPK